MNTKTIDRLYLEISQFTEARTKREIDLSAALREANELCRSMSSIVDRRGSDTNWPAFGYRLDTALVQQHLLLHRENK